MAGPERPGETGKAAPGKAFSQQTDNGELDRRRQQLDAALSARIREEKRVDDERAKSSTASGYATALKLSGEFIAGILVGAAIGWVIDRVAGTTPWGLIVFLLLGFCAGILNVLRSSGLVAERKMLPAERKSAKPDEDE